MKYSEEARSYAVKIIVYESYIGVNVSCKHSADRLVSNHVPFNAG